MSTLVDRLIAEEPPPAETITTARVRGSDGILRLIRLTGDGWLELSAEMERLHPRTYARTNMFRPRTYARANMFC